MSGNRTADIVSLQEIKRSRLGNGPNIKIVTSMIIIEYIFSPYFGKI